MSRMLAKSIVADLRIALNDLGVDASYWTDSELLSILNDGTLAIALVKPDAISKQVDRPLVDGPRQTLPDDGLRLLDVVHGLENGARTGWVSFVDRTDLDAVDPDWYSRPNNGRPIHYTYDTRDPRVFWLYRDDAPPPPPPCAPGEWSLLEDTGLPSDNLMEPVYVSGSTWLIAGGFDTNLMFRSTDNGLSWSQISMPAGGGLLGLAKGGNTLLALGKGGQILRSTDAGQNWTDVSPVGADDIYDAAAIGDTWLAVGQGEKVYRSTDGGLTWSTPRVVIRDTDANVFNDKQTITADPHDSRFVYAVWDRLVFPHERASVQSSFRALGYRGPTWFARSTDGGATWERARMIYDPGQVNQTIGNQIVVLPNGHLVNVFDLIFNFKNAKGVRGLNVALIRSTDRGATWSKSPIIVDKLGTIGNFDPETGDPVRTGDIIPDVAGLCGLGHAAANLNQDAARRRADPEASDDRCRGAPPALPTSCRCRYGRPAPRRSPGGTGGAGQASANNRLLVHDPPSSGWMAPCQQGRARPADGGASVHPHDAVEARSCAPDRRRTRQAGRVI
jgi:hypothetical protein